MFDWRGECRGKGEEDVGRRTAGREEGAIPCDCKKEAKEEEGEAPTDSVLEASGVEAAREWKEEGKGTRGDEEEKVVVVSVGGTAKGVCVATCE